MNDEKNNSLLKWIGAIIAAIIPIVVGAWFASDYGIFKQAPGPNAKILDFPTSIQLNIDTERIINVTVINDGNASAEQCNIHIRQGHKDNKVTSDIEPPIPSWFSGLHVSSETVGIEPGKTHIIALHLMQESRYLINPTDFYEINAQLVCISGKSLFYNSNIEFFRDGIKYRASR